MIRKIGQVYKVHHEGQECVSLLCHTEQRETYGKPKSKVCLMPLDGNRWEDPVYVKDVCDISEEEWSKIAGGINNTRIEYLGMLKDCIKEVVDKLNSLKEISIAEAKSMLENYQNGKFFTVVFVKRGDGSTRVMNCRKGVRQDTSGEGHRYDPASKGLICVRDVKKRQHRMIPLENIKEIRMAGKRYQVV